MKKKSGGWIVIYNPTKNPIELEDKCIHILQKKKTSNRYAA